MRKMCQWPLAKYLHWVACDELAISVFWRYICYSVFCIQKSSIWIILLLFHRAIVCISCLALTLNIIGSICWVWDFAQHSIFGGRTLLLLLLLLPRRWRKLKTCWVWTCTFELPLFGTHLLERLQRRCLSTHKLFSGCVTVKVLETFEVDYQLHVFFLERANHRFHS